MPSLFSVRRWAGIQSSIMPVVDGNYGNSRQRQPRSKACPGQAIRLRNRLPPEGLPQNQPKKRQIASRRRKDEITLSPLLWSGAAASDPPGQQRQYLQTMHAKEVGDAQVTMIGAPSGDRQPRSAVRSTHRV